MGSLKLFRALSCITTSSHLDIAFVAAARWAGQNAAHDSLRSCGRLARERIRARRQRRHLRHQHGDAVLGPPGAWPHFEGSAEPTGLFSWCRAGKKQVASKGQVYLLAVVPNLDTIVAFSATNSKNITRRQPGGSHQPSHAALASEMLGSNW